MGVGGVSGDVEECAGVLVALIIRYGPRQPRRPAAPCIVFDARMHVCCSHRGHPLRLGTLTG